MGWAGAATLPGFELGFPLLHRVSVAFHCAQLRRVWLRVLPTPVSQLRRALGSLFPFSKMSPSASPQAMCSSALIALVPCSRLSPSLSQHHKHWSENHPPTSGRTELREASSSLRKKITAYLQQDSSFMCKEGL